MKVMTTIFTTCDGKMIYILWGDMAL